MRKLDLIVTDPLHTNSVLKDQVWEIGGRANVSLVKPSQGKKGLGEGRPFYPNNKNKREQSSRQMRQC